VLNLKEIFTAWLTFSNPTQEEINLAQGRFEICKGCTYKKEIILKKDWALLCGKCGCPIKSKIFSKSINPCPMGYWKEFDTNFGLKTEEKTNPTIL